MCKNSELRTRKPTKRCVCFRDQSSPLGQGHLDVVARQQRSIGELELKHLPFIILFLIVWAWRVCEDVVNPTLLTRLWTNKSI